MNSEKASNGLNYGGKTLEECQEMIHKSLQSMISLSLSLPHQPPLYPYHVLHRRLLVSHLSSVELFLWGIFGPGPDPDSVPDLDPICAFFSHLQVSWRRLVVLGDPGVGSGGSVAVVWRGRASSAPKVKFLMEEMKKAGCPISRYFIKPVRCKQRASGFFASGKGILVCSNFLRYQDEVNQVVTHELIHAYDECRAANLNWCNCVHQACSEIRANNLSGDCHYMRELLRGHINFTNFGGHQPDCVRRRATISVRANPACTEYMADMAVKAAWETCYNDTKPFNKAP